MEMEEHQVTECIIAVILVDMIHFHHVFLSKRQSTPSALPLLLLQELGSPGVHHGMSFQALAPIQQVAIVGAGRPSYLFMSLNGRVPVELEFGTHWGTKGVSPINLFPVFRINPTSLFPGMSSSAPTL